MYPYGQQPMYNPADPYGTASYYPAQPQMNPYGTASYYPAPQQAYVAPVAGGYGAYGAYPQPAYTQPAYTAQYPAYPQQGYVGAVAAAPVSAYPAGVAMAAPVQAVSPYPPGQSVFTTPITFQVRKNYVNEIGKGEMDIYLQNLPYYRLISNPAPNHLFGWGHNYALYDLMNNQLAYIEQEVRLGMPHFNIYVRGQRYAKLKKEFTILNKIFHLDTEDGAAQEHIKIKGDWFSMSFRLQRSDGKMAAQVTGTANNDMYDVVVQPGEDALMILLAVLTVEKLCRQ